MAKKSKFEMLAEHKDRTITLVKYNGAKVTIKSTKQVGEDEKAEWLLCLPEVPTDEFRKAFKSMVGYVVSEAFQVPDKDQKAIWNEQVEINKITWKEKKGETAATVSATIFLPDGRPCGLKLPDKVLLRATKGKYPAPKSGVEFSEGTTLKLLELITQAKLYLSGDRAQAKLPGTD